MTEPRTPSPAWYRALTLAERRTLASRDTPPNADAARDAARGARRLARWWSQPALDEVARRRHRLAADGITETDLQDLLGDTDTSLAERIATPPPWSMALERTFPAADGAALGETGAEGVDELDVIRPLVDQGRTRVRCAIERLQERSDALPVDADGIEVALVDHLREHLVALLGRTLALELNVTRLQRLLEGATPEERFRSFLQRLRRPEIARTLFHEYPVLARDLARCIDQWAAFSVEILDHLHADWQAIRLTFSPRTVPGRLVEIEMGAGDRHRDGRSVALLRFSSGLRLVYKPRSLAAELHFQQLLAWLNERGAQPPFRTMRVLDRSTYGWVEFVAAAGCASADEVWRFYARQGAYLALLYALHGTDIHFENIIAAGEHPVLIDLESMFQPRRHDDPPADIEQRAWRVILDSVLGVGLLPQRVWVDGNSTGVDVSGLAAAAGEEIPIFVPRMERVGTDEMRIERIRATVPDSQHRPTLAGNAADLLDYAQAIRIGFTRTYCLLLAHREELLAGDGPLARFVDAEVRVILRPTQEYGMLLLNASHPDLLRDALDRDRLFDQLWGDVAQRPYLERTVAAERADLERGDVPLFTTRTGTRDLWTSSGVRLARFFDESGVDMARHRLMRLSEGDLRDQQWLLDASLATTAMAEEQVRWPGPAYRLPWRDERVGRPRLLAAARRIGDRLARLAIRGDDDATWLGLTPIGERHVALTPLGPDLYDGLSGVALFLAHLGAATGEERYTALARAATATIRRQIRRYGTSITLIGGFAGWGGVIYTLAHLGALWQQPDLLAEAEDLVTQLPPLIDQDEQLDLLAGAAGCIGGLLALHRCTRSDQALAMARRCGERLLARVQPMTQGVGWMVPPTARHALTGLSHGAAGIAWALLELAAVTGEASFRSAALDAIAYERSRFSPAEGNWPDLREYRGGAAVTTQTEPNYAVLWCNGAPGIGLARLSTLDHLDDGETRSEIETALQTTLREGFELNHSLCHGDLGNLELLLNAARTLDDRRWQAEAERMTAAILASVEQDGPHCGGPLGVEFPGLMTGLAGIGYGLLRAADPATVPAVLTLAPPRVHGARLA